MPNKTVQFLSVEEALAIHERLIGRFGGQAGIRDRGLLESALYRAQTGHYATLEEMAAAQFESLLINHPFVDGNKRMALFATDVFLRLNGWKLSLDGKQAYSVLISLLDTSKADFAHLLPWIRTHLRKL